MHSSSCVVLRPPRFLSLTFESPPSPTTDDEAHRRYHADWIYCCVSFFSGGLMREVPSMCDGA